MSKVKIHYKKSENYIQITGWDNMLMMEQLPERYFYLLPYFHQVNDREFVLNSRTIHKGDVFSKYDFAKIVGQMKKAGDKLHNLKHPKWSEEKEITI